MNSVKIGVCIFENPNSPRGGFASLDGEPASYVQGYNELSAEHLWVTNIEYAAYKELNLLRLKYLTDGQYFRTSLRVFQSELGIQEPRRVAEVMSKVFTRVASMGHDFFGAVPKNHVYRFHQSLSDRIYIPGMSEPVTGLDSNVVQLIIDQSTQENQAMAGIKRPDRSSPVTFAFPRDAFAQWLFSRPYPTGSAWREGRLDREYTIGTKDGKKLALTNTFINKCSVFLRKHNMATFFRITVKSQENSHRHFAAFGAGKRDLRNWVSYPELLELVEYSMIIVHDSVSTEAGMIKEHLPDYCNITGCGLADGILFENLYAALAAPVNRKATALGAYMRAYDRAACGRAAAHFHNAGFVVGSYSVGRVVLMLTEGQKERARQVALDYGMLPPLKAEVVNG